MATFFRTVAIALAFIPVTAVLSILHGFITGGSLSLANVFTWNFLLGGFFIVVGFVKMMVPARIKDKLIDHSTFIERYLTDQHKTKQERAFGLLLLGLLINVITGLIQLVLAFVIRI